ncbi:MAG TPA: hypothetical protein VJ180_08350, partial [Pyrinomonadaceae bacterium]|nr:hypothetical protein [Pyrinomonadaceae bacterium]
RLRALVHKAFTPSLVGRMRDRIQTLADELLERAMYASEIDVIKDYALPLPMTIITEILGVPTRDHHNSGQRPSFLLHLRTPRSG